MSENNSLDWVMESVDLSAIDSSQMPETPDVAQWDAIVEDGMPSVDLSTVPIPDSAWNVSLDDLVESEALDPSKLIGLAEEQQETPKALDESVFLDSWENARIKTRPWTDDTENFWKYLRRFFFSSIITLISVLAIVTLFHLTIILQRLAKIQ